MQMYIGSKYQLLVSLITNNRKQPWKSQIGQPLVKSRAEVHKQDPVIGSWGVQALEDEVEGHVYCIIYRPVGSVGKLQGGPGVGLWWLFVYLPFSFSAEHFIILNSLILGTLIWIP